MRGLLRESLDRTLLLMRDELREGVGDGVLMQALTQTEAALCGDAHSLSSHAAQSAYITAALLMARSGHRVYLLAPDVPLQSAQPPLRGRALVSALFELGRDLLPGIEFTTQLPQNPVDLAVRFGDSAAPVLARRHVSVNATAWSATLSPGTAAISWREPHWPFGAMAAGALAAGEAFKVSMRRLRCFARVHNAFEELFAPGTQVQATLAPEGAPQGAQLGRFDIVSGGAIANAILFSLSRIPNATGVTRILEDTSSDHSNLNRYQLLRRSEVGEWKVKALQQADLGKLRVTGSPVRYDERSRARVGTLAPVVLVGVDHIPTRWFIQTQHDGWLAIGATTHWSAMASFHHPENACAMCLHPHDDPTDTLVPTVAFVSFWSGLLAAAYFARRAAGEQIALAEQQVFLTPLRPESAWKAPVSRRLGCPICGEREARVVDDAAA